MRRRQTLERPEYFRLNPYNSLYEGLVAFYGAGGGCVGTGQCFDSADYPNHGTLTNFAWPNTATSGWKWIPQLGRFGQAIDNTSNYVNCGASTRLKPTGDMTLSGWCQGKSNSITSGMMAGTTGYSGSRGYCLGPAYDTTKTVSANVPVSATDVFSIAVAGINVSTSWTHYAFVFKASVGLYLYQNGVMAGSNVVSPPASQYRNSNALRLGSRGDDDSYFIGSISDQLLFDRALSPAEINILANPSDPFLGGLIEPVWQRVYAAAVAAGNRRRRVMATCGA